MKEFKGAKVASVIFALIIIMIVANIIYLGATGMHFISGKDIYGYAQNRNTKEVVDYAKRGEIITEDGQVVATNVQKYTLRAVVDVERLEGNGNPAYVTDIEAVAKAIAPIIGMDEAAMISKMVDAQNNGLYQVQFGVYGNNLSATEKNQIDAFAFTGIEFDEIISRNYPLGNFSSYLIGYSQNEEKNGVSQIVGKMGLELLYDDQLSGKNGYTVYQADSSGYVLPNGILEEVDKRDGENIHLTINSTLQRDMDIELAKAVEDTGAEFGTAAIMDAKTGEVLAMSNVPTFDPNVRDVENYTNRFTNYLIEPGSVMKSFVYANAIEDGVYQGTDTFKSGEIEINGSTIRDWNGGEGFGTITYDKGLAMSSNVGIVNLIDNYSNKQSLKDDFDQLGFFEDLTTDIGVSKGGYAGYMSTDRDLELMTAGFGQGMTTTPLHILQAYSVFANDGKMVTPYFIERIEDPTTKEVSYTGTTSYSAQIYSSQTIAEMQRLLTDNLYSEENVARVYAMDNQEIIGKTGTAQVAGSDGRYRTDVYIKSFAGVTTVQGSEIVIYVAMQASGNAPATPMGDFVKTMVTNTIASRTTANSNSDENYSYTTKSYINQSVSYVKSSLEGFSANVIAIGNGSSVINQYPEANTELSAHDKIFLMTNGTEVKIPDFSGWSRKDVATYCSLTSLEVTYGGVGSTVASQNISGDTVITADMKLEIILE